MRALHYLFYLLIGPLTLCGVSPVRAQGNTTTTTTSVNSPPVATSSVATSSAVIPAPTPRPPRAVVVGVRSITNREQDSILRPGDVVELRVTHLGEVLKANKERKFADLRFYADGIPMKPADVLEPTVDTTRLPIDSVPTGRVLFTLTRNSQTEKFWQLFYHVPTKRRAHVQVSLGFADKQIATPYPALSTKNGPVVLELLRMRWLVAGALLIAGLLGLLVWLGSRSNLLRNDNHSLASRTPPPGAFDPAYRTVAFSLTKAHLALWTFLIGGSYIMIYMVTGEPPLLGGGVLELLGITSISTLASKVISRSQQDRISSATRHQDRSSQGFWLDILTDEAGVSVSRVQFVVFNLIAGLFLLRGIIKEWAFPDLPEQLLTLILISNSTFVALKSVENRETKDIPTGLAPAGLVPAALTPAALTPAGPLPAGNPERPQNNPGRPDAGLPAGAPTVDANGTPLSHEQEDNAPPGTLPSVLPVVPPSNLGLG